MQMNEDLQRILKPRTLAADWSRNCWNQTDEVLKRQNSGQPEPENLIRELSFYHDLRESVSKGFDSAYKTGAVTVLAPVGLFGLVEGFAAPDWDISTLGIGYHRYFLFHSAIGLVVLRHFYRQWRARTLEQQSGWCGKVKQKVVGTMFGTVAAGVGIHLLVDVFQPKSIVFPFFGSLVEGTLVDDNIWLLGNSLWAFRISHEVFSLVLADEMTLAKDYASQRFGGLTDWQP